MLKGFSTGILLVLALPTLARCGVLLKHDFEGTNPWSAATMNVTPDTPLPVEPEVTTSAVGTINKVGTAEASGGLLLTADVGDATSDWQAHFHSGMLEVRNAEANLAKLTLAFDLSASINRPVIVRFESFDAQRRRTGGLETTVYPAAPNFYLRSAIDLSTMKPHGAGKFRPTDPFVQITYVIEGPSWPSNAVHTLRVDNINYANPSYYVSPTGSDSNDGRTEDAPLKTPQKAVDLAKPGDIVLLMDGTYTRPQSNSDQSGIVQFDGLGTPDAWIVLKNYPGHKPVLFNTDSWNSVRIGGPIRNPAVPETEVAYFEVRGLRFKGNADKVKEERPDDIGKPLPTTNGNAMTVDPTRRKLISHHFRMADNFVEYQPGGGISALGGDHIQIENNEIYNNCWYMIYAGSGISILSPHNYDTADNVHKILIRGNRVSGNRTYMPWGKIKKVSDGNGIILDSYLDPERLYIGRTLVQNNISINNGGSGIHSFKARRIDVVNNTAFLNGASPELRWGQIFLQRIDDSRMLNNVMIGRDGQPVNTVSRDITDRGNTNIKRANNVYFGGSFKPIMGENDVFADPMFVAFSWDLRTSDVRLRPGSPALGAGRWEDITPLTDIDGKPRDLKQPPSAGAY